MSKVNTFAALAADGNSASLELLGDVNTVDVYLKDGANDGGGTLKLQSSFDGGTTWVDVPSASWTSGDGHLGRYTVFGRDVRFNLAGSTTPSNMVVTVRAVPVSQARVDVFGPLTDNGNTDVVLGTKGQLAVFAKGTWDSGSLTLAFSPDGGTNYFDSGLTAITANGGGIFANASNEGLLRLVLASVAGAAADLDVWVYSIPA